MSAVLLEYKDLELHFFSFEPKNCKHQDSVTDGTNSTESVRGLKDPQAGSQINLHIGVVVYLRNYPDLLRSKFLRLESWESSVLGIMETCM